MNKKTRKLFASFIKSGYVVSMWEDKKRRQHRRYACEISKPAWAGSCCVNGASISKALVKCAKEVLADPNNAS